MIRWLFGYCHHKVLPASRNHYSKPWFPDLFTSLWIKKSTPTLPKYPAPTCRCIAKSYSQYNPWHDSNKCVCVCLQIGQTHPLNGKHWQTYRQIDTWDKEALNQWISEFDMIWTPASSATKTWETHQPRVLHLLRQAGPFRLERGQQRLFALLPLALCLRPGSTEDGMGIVPCYSSEVFLHGFQTLTKQ